MNLWIDDVRSPPNDYWLWAKNAKDAKVLLQKYSFDTISFDHDLGENQETGYDLISWVERQVMLNPNFPTPGFIQIHSMNPVGRERMEMVKENINRAILENN